MNTEGRIVTADSQGVFGSPAADAERAKITPGTKDLLVIFYVPVGFDLEAPMKAMVEFMTTICGCTLSDGL
jgi:DNA/RNA-binding domain of Phe-tRNA-synthetase-like protein